MLGVELTSLLFLLIELYRYGYRDSGSALVAFRFMKMVVGLVIVNGVYFPPSQSFLKSFMDFSPYIDWDHMIAESKVYLVVSVLSVVDLTFVVFLPWKNSRFATLSKGFPNLVLFRLVQGSLLMTALVSFLIQLTYLSTTEFILQRDLTFIVNIVLLSIKLSLITMEFFYKNHVLGVTPTVLDNNNNGKDANDAHDVESGKEEHQIEYTLNPLMANGRKPDDEESKPLLEKSVKHIQAKVGDLEIEMSTVRTETNSKVNEVETKVSGVETKVNEVETKMSLLEQENSALKLRINSMEMKLP